MPSNYETFFDHHAYAVVGHHARKPFPRLTYAGLKKRGKQVFPVDPTLNAVEGDKTFASLADLPSKVDAAVLELPQDETKDWVDRVAQAGIKHLWLHQNSDTPAALAAAQEHGLQVRHGTCAVMYLNGGFPHFIHKFIQRLRKKY